MHEYELLERRWQKYRYKKLLVKGLFAAALIALASLLLPYKSVSKFEPTSPKNQTTNYLAPSLEFEKRLLAKKSAQSRPSKPIQPVKKVKKQNTAHLAISATKLTLPQMLQNYKKHPSIDLANMIANEYYQQKEYQKAMQWAIKANELDKDNEQSWILYAKSAYKLGQKQKAINALKIYLRKHPSKRVKKLLSQMAQKDSL